MKAKTKEESKKKARQADEILDAIGQENEAKGVEETKRFMAMWDKKEWEKNQFTQQKLKKKVGNKEKYTQALYDILYQEIRLMEIPIGYQADVKITKKGIVVGYKPLLGFWKYRAFTPCGTPKIDFHHVMDLLGSMYDSMWHHSDITSIPNLHNDGKITH